MLAQIIINDETAKYSILNAHRSWIIVQSTDLWFNHADKPNAMSMIARLCDQSLQDENILIWITEFVELLHVDKDHVYLKSAIISLCNCGENYLWNFDSIYQQQWMNDLMIFKSVRDAKYRWHLSLVSTWL